ncbi:hypothetical protein KIPB_016397, partial [Kipferlia bialata]
EFMDCDEPRLVTDPYPNIEVKTYIGATGVMSQEQPTG